MGKGYIHVYTGNGKGKTTAALGLSLRAIFAGKKVFFGQFIKGMDYSELESQRYLPNFKIQQFGRDCFIYNNPTDEDIRMAKEGLEICKRILNSHEYDIVVLDEINIATYYRLLDPDDIIDILKNREPKIEVILTGRYADEKIIEFADLVTEMKEIKHYYYRGVEARKGIEK
ncbi:cob(I)alamin adenosyltransferase [Tissierella praeacuta DSM 18095]|uniref:Cob(I)alamin adenosyltransferase n=1 Tax=Tissierella praeacuta DSM 18095 TaxID=1123404 RepID=A0A1M4SRD3_9FIRM|nr:cob(I)yrinic acid a,c-diamide adenosyltransferase [Tissierella praeacuta]SHE34823.1 cob(I)alamin adenosyltransferase [Tissierella praeacuta DSM 18095]SUP01685.1 Cob(I)yrinic acid a,c-diamide adenosyltransferase [Tissierella praeacuta]